jgi:hypothetical protein
MEVSAMARTHLPNGRFGHLTRDYEFSRLQKEWMASVYALILPSSRRRQRLRRSSAAALAGLEGPSAAAVTDKEDRQYESA